MWRAVLLACCLGVSQPAAAQEGTIRIVLGFPAGASSDLLTRLLADQMRAALGRAVIVENRVGAGGQIANEAVKSAAPDGHTLLMTPVATMAIYPHTYPNLRYDPFNDFEPLAHLAKFQLALGVSAKVPAATLAEYVALVKKDPNAGYYASASAGSIPHFFGVMFGRAAGIDMTHVPYKGTAPVLQALATGEIAAASTLAADIGALARAGKARILATTGRKRSPAFPDVPTFRESGYDIEGTGWYGLFAPAATPTKVVARLSAAAVDAMRAAQVRSRLESLGLEPTGLGPRELAAIMKRDYERWGPVIKASGFKAEN
ncbi:MAG TPA: tripartite tricarboxylate transporter substrate-binding protein [Burkholderiales bacterium]|jgi:tripartite-type tricarboxylate transporter receptor subunit TctC|nr:tripartite tricarboxylate transporter substrate-binding protein [Burkholderiales bacterium]